MGYKKGDQNSDQIFFIPLAYVFCRKLNTMSFRWRPTILADECVGVVTLASGYLVGSSWPQSEQSAYTVPCPLRVAFVYKTLGLVKSG